MKDNINKENNAFERVTAPQDLAKENYYSYLEKNKTQLSNLNFMETYTLNLNSNCIMPCKNRFLISLYGVIFAVNYIKKANNLTIRKATNFTVKDAVSIRHIYNDKSCIKDDVYYSLNLITDKGYEKSGIEIKSSAKSNFNKFQETLSSEDNNFQLFFYNDEFMTFIEDFIQPKFNKKIINIYENCGKIGPNLFLGEDFLIDKGKIFKVNKDGLISTQNKNVFIKANNRHTFKLPILSNSSKSANIVAKEFIENIIDSWNKNYLSALLIIGHMVMGLFFDKFTMGQIGVPILVVSGISGCGKSTIIQNGISIFGFGEEFLISGNSTVLGQQFLANAINCVNICVDDLSDSVISSKHFGDNIKRQFKAIPRVKRKNYGKDVCTEHQCSQIIYSTNSSLPQIPELENRANLISIFNNSLDTNKYKYLSEHRENTKNLSLILPELLKFDENQVLEIHSNLKKYLKDNISDNVIERLPHNIAYMWTGIKLLEEIAGISLDIQNDILKYAKEVVEHYKSLPTPIDVLINGLLTLKNHRAIIEHQHYKVRKEKDRIWLVFNKDTLLTAHNNFFKEENRKINLNIFNNYLKLDKRFVNPKISANYKGEYKHSIALDITDSPDVWEFSGFPEPIETQDNQNASLSALESIITNQKDIT